jgi:hypothetical protein
MSSVPLLQEEEGRRRRRRRRKKMMMKERKGRRTIIPITFQYLVLIIIKHLFIQLTHILTSLLFL